MSKQEEYLQIDVTPLTLTPHEREQLILHTTFPAAGKGFYAHVVIARDEFSEVWPQVSDEIAKRLSGVIETRTLLR